MDHSYYKTIMVFESSNPEQQSSNEWNFYLSLYIENIVLFVLNSRIKPKGVTQHNVIGKIDVLR